MGPITPEFYFFVFVCMLYAHSCGSTATHISQCTCRVDETSSGIGPCLTSCLRQAILLYSETYHRLAGLQASESLLSPVPSHCRHSVIKGVCYHIQLYMASGDSKTGPQASLASDLPTQISPHA